MKFKKRAFLFLLHMQFERELTEINGVKTHPSKINFFQWLLYRNLITTKTYNKYSVKLDNEDFQDIDENEFIKRLLKM